MDVKLSIVVPVYNAEQYISECLNSLLKQGFVDGYEVIVVDDCSTDKSKEIIESYSGKYDYIKLIPLLKNGGVSNARNVGIQNSRGQYLSFVDADDKVYEGVFFTLTEFMDSHSISYLRFNRSFTESKMHTLDISLVKCLSNKYIPLPVWGGIYKLDIINRNSISFNTGVLYREDYLFNYQYLQCSSPFFYQTDQPLYFYRQNQSSSTANIFCHKSKVERVYNSYLTVLSSIKKDNMYPNFDEEIYTKSISQMIVAMVWLSYRGRIKPIKLMNDLKKCGLNLKDIKYKFFEGYSIKSKVKMNLEYYSKYKFFFLICYHLYPIINFISKIKLI